VAIREAGDRLDRLEALLAAVRAASEGPGVGGEGRGVRDEGLGVRGQGSGDREEGAGVSADAAQPDPGTEYSVLNTSPSAAPAEDVAEPVVAVGENPPPSAADAATSSSGLRDLFDIRLLQAYPDCFAPYQAFLSDWIRRELVPREKLGLAPAAGAPSIAAVEQPEGHYRLRWSWPEERLANQCTVAVCPAEPGPCDKPEQAAAVWRAEVSRHEGAEADGSRVIPVERGWEGSYVVVWAIVDAGFARFHSSPLVLGRIPSRSRWKWPRLFSGKPGNE